MPYVSLPTYNTIQDQRLLKLSARDRKKATNMLKWEHLDECGLDPDWRRELQVMLMLNMKAEIQLLDELLGGVQGWLLAKLGAI